MTLKRKKNNFKLFFIIILLIIFIIPNNVFALLDNKLNNLIRIDSESQSFEAEKNIAIFNGNVILVYKNIKIFSNKIIISNINKKNAKEIIIDAYGDPINFYQKQKTGNLIKGRAHQLHFELLNNLVILLGNAYIEELNNNISCYKIILSLKEKKIQAYSLNKNKRIYTVLLPSYNFFKN